MPQCRYAECTEMEVLLHYFTMLHSVSGAHLCLGRAPWLLEGSTRHTLRKWGAF